MSYELACDLNGCIVDEFPCSSNLFSTALQTLCLNLTIPGRISSGREQGLVRFAHEHLTGLFVR
jgi:hypothetical protein